MTKKKRYLLDSNIVIYSALPENAHLREFIDRHSPSVSAITRLEVLGYSRITPADRRIFELFFEVSKVWPVSEVVIDLAIQLRQIKSMSLGDAIIGATGLWHNLHIVTRNTKDFAHIEGLKVYNPMKEGPGSS
ncbi:type II toxin-antitoxin system VapC family toxin [Roseivirga sp. BDSF3-8]|uniref:type II toxin-antitoxin system VapC family toxin n=1 Tax=Roseivirga sp. BDSF3-8 TaxID=3241598 RepID=UPI003531F9C6